MIKSKKLIKYQIITQLNQNIFKNNKIVLIDSNLLLSDIKVKTIKLHKLSLLKIFPKLNILKYFTVSPCSLRIIHNNKDFFNGLLNPLFYPLLIKYKNIICLNKLYPIKIFFNTSLIINKIHYIFGHIILKLTRMIFKIFKKENRV